jgi:acyl-CoA synthetase (AMP-forming)/AMP-acid ligase II
MLPSNLIELLGAQARQYGFTPKYASLDGELAVARTLSFAELERSAQSIGTRVREDCREGGRVLIACVNSLDFLEAFFGCLAAGGIPVPVCPPRPRRPLTYLSSIARDVEACAIMAPRRVWRWAADAIREDETLSSLPWIFSDELPRDCPADSVRASEIAFIQYTSGSTAEPRGLVIGHANVMSNCAYIQAGFRHSPETVSVTWLPHYHDMGLIAGLLQPLYIGHACYCLEPMQFLQQPMRWLHAISRLRADHSGGPPFGYRLCCEKMDPAKVVDLDLSCWRTAYVGAEPIHKQVLDRFAATFGPTGFRDTSFYAAYGLAEATLKVTGGRPGEGVVYRRSPEGRVLTGCGRASCGVEVRIADPATGAECNEGEVGEVWVSGPGVARAWSREPATVFDSGKSYLRTGDLGLLEDGVLFVTGRLKELMIIKGRNIYPQDIERTAIEWSAQGKPEVAAFSVEEFGEERIVLLHETGMRPTFDSKALATGIRAAIVREHDIDISRILFVKHGTIPRTTSGKLRRLECRSLYLSGQIEAVGVSARGAST